MRWRSSSWRRSRRATCVDIESIDRLKIYRAPDRSLKADAWASRTPGPRDHGPEAGGPPAPRRRVAPRLHWLQATRLRGLLPGPLATARASDGCPRHPPRGSCRRPRRRERLLHGASRAGGGAGRKGLRRRRRRGDERVPAEAPLASGDRQRRGDPRPLRRSAAPRRRRRPRARGRHLPPPGESPRLLPKLAARPRSRRASRRDRLRRAFELVHALDGPHHAARKTPARDVRGRLPGGRGARLHRPPELRDLPPGNLNLSHAERQQREASMGLRERLKPRIQDFAMRFMDELRPPTVGAAVGSVLEVGFGTARNIEHYGKDVERLTGLDPMRTEGIGAVEERIARARFPVERAVLRADAQLPFDAGRAADLDDYDPAKGALRVNKTIQGARLDSRVAHTKNRTSRMKEVWDQQLREWLEWRLAQATPKLRLRGETALFPNPTARNTQKRWTVSGLEREWRRACARARVDYIPLQQGTRHSILTTLGQALPERVLRDFSRHRDTRSLDRYSNPRATRGAIVRAFPGLSAVPGPLCEAENPELPRE